MTMEARPAPRRGAARRWLFAKRWPLLGMVMAVLGVGAWLGAIRLTAPAALTMPALPVPNGYDDVLRAGRATQAEGDGNGTAIVDVTTAAEATLLPIVEANREALAIARRGLDRPFQVPVVYEMNDIAGRLMHDLGEIRRLARALFAEGRLAELQGRTDDASRAYLDLVRLGDAMSRRVPMLPFLVSVAIQGMGLRGLRDLRTGLDTDQCRRLIGGLQDQDRDREPVANVIRFEHQFMDANVRKMGLVMRASVNFSGLLKKEKARATTPLLQSERRMDAGRRLLLADLALRRYRLEHGEAPRDLDALVPAILRSVPIDPYSGKPLIYRERAEGDPLYSTGPDGDDDRLSPMLGRRHLDPSNGDFTLDSF